MKRTLTEPQADLLRKIAAASSAMPIPPARIQTSWALEQRNLIKRTWRGSGHVAVVTADGRYYLKHGKHPRQIQAEERLKGDATQAAQAPADGAELISRLQSASGKITVPPRRPGVDGGRRTTTRFTMGTYPEGTSCDGTADSVATGVFAPIDEEAEKAAQPPPVPAVDVPETLDQPHRLVRATRKALGRSQSVVDTRNVIGIVAFMSSEQI